MNNKLKRYFNIGDSMIKPLSLCFDNILPPVEDSFTFRKSRTAPISIRKQVLKVASGVYTQSYLATVRLESRQTTEELSYQIWLYRSGELFNNVDYITTNDIICNVVYIVK